MTETPRAAARLSLLLAEDHPVMREGMASLLEKEGNFVVAGLSASARETYRTLTERFSNTISLARFSAPIICCVLNDPTARSIEQ